MDGPQGLIEFQCVEIDSVEVDGDAACVVVDDTVIECDGEPIDLTLTHEPHSTATLSPGIPP